MRCTKRKADVLTTAAALLALATTTAASAGAPGGGSAQADSYRVHHGSTLRVGGRGVFANDPASLTTVVRNTAPAHGTLSLPGNVAPLRIVTIDLKTLVEHEYVYLLDDPKTNSGAVSEITALSDSTFLVDERDGKVEPNAYKKLLRIDLHGATDVGPQAAVPGATYDATHGGLLVGAGKQTIKGYTQHATTTADAAAALSAANIAPLSKSLSLDVGALVRGLDPTGGFFGHDKVEGVAVQHGGRTIVLSNDSDFGVAAAAQSTPPFGVHPKILPNGMQDDGEYLAVHTDRLPATSSTATVTISVR